MAAKDACHAVSQAAAIIDRAAAVHELLRRWRQAPRNVVSRKFVDPPPIFVPRKITKKNWGQRRPIPISNKCLEMAPGGGNCGSSWGVLEWLPEGGGQQLSRRFLLSVAIRSGFGNYWDWRNVSKNSHRNQKAKHIASANQGDHKVNGRGWGSELRPLGPNLSPT